MSIFVLECSKMRCQLGLRPSWGAYNAPPEPLAVGREENDEIRKEGEELRECKKSTSGPQSLHEKLMALQTKKVGNHWDF